MRGTLRALLEPKRLLPVLLVCTALVMAQGSFSRDRLAIPLGIALCLAFVVVAPVSWRMLFPAPTGIGLAQSAVRLALYGAIGTGVVLVLGSVVPRWLHMGQTFLTTSPSLWVCVALFVVGGWGLGRDIGMERRLRLLAAEAERAQLLALRSHLDPHFLFNTLNAIAEWCRQDGEVAERAVLQLSAMLRDILSGVQAPSWPLERELALVRTLLALHLLRDPNLFSLTEEVPAEALSLPVPPLLLLPLAENAMKHGPSAGHRGEVRLEVRRGPEETHVSLENPGAFSGKRDGGHGLPLLERRLRAAYGGRAQLHIGPGADGRSTRATLRLPNGGPDTGALV